MLKALKPNFDTTQKLYPPVRGRSLAWLRFLLGVQEIVSSNLTDPTIFTLIKIRYVQSLNV